MERPPISAVGAIELPSALKVRIEAVRRRRRRLQAVMALGTLAAGAAASFLAFYAWERFDETPPAARWLLWSFAAACGTLPWVAWAWRWAWRPPDPRELARYIQRQLPRLGDRLLGAVELAAPMDPEHARWSEPLRRAAIDQVAREADRIDVRHAAPAQLARRIALVAAALFGSAALLIARQPEAGWNSFRRWFNPAAPIPRFTFVRIEDLPMEMIVPHGEPFELECTVRGRLARRAAVASCRLGRAVWTHAVGADGRVRFRIPGPTRPARLSLRIGDAVRHVQLRPEPRPALVELFATVRPPPWHGRSEDRRALESGWLAVPEGGEVVLSGRASRELAEVTVNGPRGPSVIISGARFETARLAAVTGAPPAGVWRLPDEIVLQWRDQLGLTPSAPTRIRVQRTPDAPPTVRCEGLDGAVAILEDEALQFDVVAADDHGVQRVWIEWRRAQERRDAPAPVRVRPLAEGTADAATLHATVTLSPEAMRWSPDMTLELWGAAVDYAPGRDPSYTPTYRIFVLSRARHAQLLEQQARAAQAVIEELRRREESRWQTSEDVAALDDEHIAQSMPEDRLRTGEAGERRDAERAARLAEEMTRLALEALRNPAIAEATVLDWAMMAEKLQSLAGGEMASAAEALRKATDRAGASARRQMARAAAEHQRAAVEQLTSILNEACRTGDEWAARSFVERLRELSNRHAELQNMLARHAPGLLGLDPDRLAPELRSELIRLADLQNRHRQEARDLRDDLTGFFERSRRSVYDEIRRAMSEPDVLDRQNESRRAILDNRVAAAMQMSGALADDFSRWAEMLSPPGGASGGAGGGGSSASLPPEVLMGLLRARARQESLREATRELDRQRLHREEYSTAAERLADRQLQIETDLRKLNDLVGGRIRNWMEAIEQDMIVSAATLREPQTDAEAIAIQTGIIEAIAEAMNSGSSASSDSSSAPSAEAMAAVTRMLRTMAQRGGGSLAGGTTSRENAEPEGAGEGATPISRPQRRGASAVDEIAPAEFRPLLEGYFRAVDPTR